MNKISNVKRILIKLADQLDQAGYEEMANQVDSAIKQVGNPEETEIEIPQEEKLMLEDVAKALQESLSGK